MNPPLQLRLVVPAEAGTQFDFGNIQMDSRFRGNDEFDRRPGAGRGPIGTPKIPATTPVHQ
jgi:hypothetical protein